MRLAATDLEIEVRPATSADVPLLLSFIRAMATFEQLPVTASEEKLRRALFGEAPAAEALLAFVGDRPVAYAVYFFTFATMTAKRGLWLDDLFVDPTFRGRGIAGALMGYLADMAIRKGCGRFEWIVLDWNQGAIDFYARLGARPQSDWRICRLEESELPSVARRLVRVDDTER